MKQKTVAFQPHATNLFFHILTACNLKCRHCYIRQDQHGSQTLSIETIEAWLALFSERKKTANVIFLGGEPTLHPDLSRAVKTAKAMGYASVTIDSNGYLFHNILEKVSPDDVDFFSFSLDGATAPTCDAIRGEGVFDICTQNARKAADKGFSTSLIYTVSDNNIHELEKMPELLKDLGISRFFIQVLGMRGNSVQDPGQKQVNRETWTSLVPQVAREVASLGIGVTWPRVFLEEKDHFECAGLVADNFFVFPNGRVYRCPLCEDYPIHAFEIQENRLMERPPLHEGNFFSLRIPEGCVMNRLVQPANLRYTAQGTPAYRIACCLLKEEILP
ncbi:radical SAM protein [Desulfobotulus sp. H1]|uniref:Radical SAM protein n=1 Tax=Desulfobotulus pelophilus TaxID=2823377 RepID=A0ABT3NBL1_9BACT|nr:radical SAM protein [Desulfobotulus pelophilus]MCW7754852.1 radical SAM protein [Desulfobotulus pelophilus]